MLNFLQASEAVAIGVHAMAMMAVDPNKTFSVGVLAEQLEASEHHCSKVMQRLHKGGLVEAVRGPGGGYKLAYKPQAITLDQIMVVLEGGVNPNACLFHRGRCRFDNCLFGNVLQEACDRVRSYFENTNLADLVESTRDTAE